MVDFQDVPQDVFLSITNHLELGDVLTLLSVCSTFRSFAKPQSLWIDILERVAKHRALALSPGTQIRDLEVEQLVRVARHTYRVQHSWEQDSPRPVRSKVLGQQAHHGRGFTGGRYGERLFATIPGTPLLVLRSVRPDAEGAMHLVALDIEEVHGPSTLQVPAFESYAHWDGPGSLIVALCGRDTPSLIVVSITYHPGAAPAMSIIYETMTATSIHRQDVFLINYVTGASAVLPEAWQPSIRTFDQPLFSIIGAAPFFVTYTENDGWTFNVNRLALDLRSTLNGHHPPCALRDVALERINSLFGVVTYRSRHSLGVSLSPRPVYSP
ncbi:hypothetical protein LshimejAT787_2300480 [Lyophyllum shimeji]|uniref:F-box domain-containing protein n=1 Tax=Lyophyllum shimeji TaxID=47721 RepID=A0A9P3UUC7_LYOSH|nr:hypothetical protein LshimejAT787_2300480 [Lyophyllum shimeji]